MMRSIKFLALTLFLTTAQPAAAQLAPTGEHYAGRSSDTGYGGTFVNATGTAAAVIPLEFPPSRGGLELPLQITSGRPGVGAAGLGWDLPLSYIQQSRTFAHRRPIANPGELPSPRERTYLALFGQNLELIADGSTWVARSGTLELSVRENAGSWLAYDGKGATYTFVRPPALGNAGLWLLKSVSMPGDINLQLTYQITTWPLDGGTGNAIDLIRIDYNTHPTTGCSKNEITLTYGNGSITPVSMSILGDQILVRKNTLTLVDANGRATCESPFERLRRYEFQYLPDTDTALPRLHTVRMFGRQGTAEENVALPIATYDYGSATSNGVLRYETTQTINLPSGVSLDQISGTALDSSVNAPVAGDRYAMWQTLTDVTGDGRPDLVFKKNNKLWVAYNQPGPSASTMLGNGPQSIVQLSDGIFANGAFATHTTAQRRFDYLPANRNTTNVWRQAIDVNGDGRIDIVDAAEEPDRWVVYLNTPGGPTGVKWERRSFSVIALRETLTSSGHPIDGDHVPLSRRATGAAVQGWDCWRWDGTKWNWYAEGFSNHRCEGTANGVTARGPERTYTEWELTDLNGDGYPDFVFNSDPVDFQLNPPPASLGQGTTGAVWPADFGVGGPHWHLFAPKSTNVVRAAFNVRGVRFYTDDDPFARSVTLKAPHAELGVGVWACSGNGVDFDSYVLPCDDSSQSQLVGLADVNGDGLVDRVVSEKAYLGAYSGTAVTFSSVFITLPGPLATQHNTHKEQCAPNGNQKPTSDQTRGLRDLTGDGIPDYFNQGQVWIGTGTGFRQGINIATSGANFRFSHETETCDGNMSNTDGGLFDIDGDGRPEVVGLAGNTLIISALAGAQASGAPEAGRLTQIDNGYGAKTSISYVSAKNFTDNPVPSPEIVVSAVAITGTLNLGGTLAGTRYAYDNAELIFDSALDRFSFSGYRRSVAVHLYGTVRDRAEGNATITDTWSLTPFSSALTKQQRWLRIQRAGRVRDILKLRGTIDPNPWSLLNVDANDSRVIGVTHHEWDAKLYEAPVAPSENVFDCLEMFLPLDFSLSVANNFGNNWIDACRSHGFAFESSRDAWYGAAQPPADENIQTRMKTLAVDDFGRATAIEYDNDLFRSDDDICAENTFAVPTSAYPRMLGALSSRRLYDCGKNNTFASESWLYDGLPAGQISQGRMTSHDIDRRSTDNGLLLSTTHVFDATYDTAGNLATMRMQRNGATRTTTYSYDSFALVPTHMRVDATGAPSIDLDTRYDPVSLDPLGSTDATQTQRGLEFDGFGRTIRATLRPPGESLSVVSTTSYLGFEGADPDGRRITAARYGDPISPTNTMTTPGRAVTVFLDELGRTRRSELALGSDYGSDVLVVGARSYDDAGRIAFEAAPYPKSQNPATAYGTSFYFKNTGDLDCFIRGQGLQPMSMVTDPAAERFPTCFQRSFVGHVDTLQTRDPASLEAGSPQSGVVKQVVTSAIGRVIERSTIKAGLRLEHATFAHDRLGQLTSMIRYLNPSVPSGPVQWALQLDSIGQTLQLMEPGAATRVYRYSDWGEPIETQWLDGGVNHQLLRTYDALGRPTSAEERSNGVTDPDTLYAYSYDAGVNVSPLVTPTFVLGHLAQATSPKGQVAFSYDNLGRVNARVFKDSQGVIYIESSERHLDGRLGSLQFNLPDQNYDSEVVKYGYDSAGRLRTVSYADASGGTQLYNAVGIDLFGRVRESVHGGNTTLHAAYATQGRRLIEAAALETALGSRQFIFQSYDPVGRELSRREIKDGAAPGAQTNVMYDPMGQLQRAVKSNGATMLFDWQYNYDPLGNIVALGDVLGSAGAVLSYSATDPDRICRIGYGPGGLGGTTCNVVYDGVGNIVEQATRTGTRRLDYFAGGKVRRITQGAAQASFSYDPFGAAEQLDITGVNPSNVQHGRRYGSFIERRDQVINGTAKSFLLRKIPGTGGIIASRRGPTRDWVFQFGELRGNRAFTNQAGAFIQDIDYQPFGEANSTGVQPGAADYTSNQWNGGDALVPFNLSQLGARVYDPVIGRFLSPDRVRAARTAHRSNPYVFARNDPLNAADPSGLDCIGVECTGLGDSAFVPILPGLPGGWGGSSTPPAQPAPNLLTIPAGATFENGKFVLPEPPPPPGMLVLTIPEGSEFADPMLWHGYNPFPKPPGIPAPFVGLTGDEPWVQAMTSIVFNVAPLLIPPLLLEALPADIALEVATVGTDEAIGGTADLAGGATRAGMEEGLLGTDEGGTALGEGADAVRGTWTAGTSRGAFTLRINQVGGKLYTTRGVITGSDFADMVDEALARGERVNILTGVHGTPGGAMIEQNAFKLWDVARFNRPGVVFWNAGTATTSEITTLLNSTETTIAGFCYSGICLQPYMWP